MLKFFHIGQDVYWNMLLWRCADNNSYQGCALPERQEYPDEDPVEGGCLNHHEEEQLVQNFEQVDWSQESSQVEFGKPVKDEDEWSDGWR